MPVRHATLDDVDTIVALGERHYDNTRWPIPKDLDHMAATAREFIEREDRLALLLEADDEDAVGFLLAADIVLALSPVRVAAIEVWHVHERHARRAKSLLSELEAWGKSRGCDGIIASAFPEAVRYMCAARYNTGPATYYKVVGTEPDHRAGLVAGSHLRESADAD